MLSIRHQISTPCPKCDDDEQVMIDEVSIQRTGELVFKCACITCGDPFTLIFRIFDLIGTAAILDNQFFDGMPPDFEETPTHCDKPN